MDLNFDFSEIRFFIFKLMSVPRIAGPIEIIDGKTDVQDLPEAVRNVSQNQVLFVSGISWEVTNEEFLDYFSRAGPILAFMINRQNKMQNTFIGYLAYKDERDADYAYNRLDKGVLRGKRMTVLWSEKNFITREKFGYRDDPKKIEKFYPPSDPSLRANIESKRNELLRLIEEEIQLRYKILEDTRSQRPEHDDLPPKQYDSRDDYHYSYYEKSKPYKMSEEHTPIDRDRPRRYEEPRRDDYRRPANLDDFREAPRRDYSRGYRQDKPPKQESGYYEYPTHGNSPTKRVYYENNERDYNYRDSYSRESRHHDYERGRPYGRDYY